MQFEKQGDPHVTVSSVRRVVKGDKTFYKSDLHVHNVTLEDSGVYSCQVFDRQKHEEQAEIYISVRGLYIIILIKELVFVMDL